MTPVKLQTELKQGHTVSFDLHFVAVSWRLLAYMIFTATSVNLISTA